MIQVYTGIEHFKKKWNETVFVISFVEIAMASGINNSLLHNQQKNYWDEK